jgi:hypothetical protein
VGPSDDVFDNSADGIFDKFVDGLFEFKSSELTSSLYSYSSLGSKRSTKPTDSDDDGIISTRGLVVLIAPGTRLIAVTDSPPTMVWPSPYKFKTARTLSNRVPDNVDPCCPRRTTCKASVFVSVSSSFVLRVVLVGNNRSSSSSTSSNEDISDCVFSTLSKTRRYNSSFSSDAICAIDESPSVFNIRIAVSAIFFAFIPTGRTVIVRLLPSTGPHPGHKLSEGFI